MSHQLQLNKILFTQLVTSTMYSYITIHTSLIVMHSYDNIKNAFIMVLFSALGIIGTLVSQSEVTRKYMINNYKWLFIVGFLLDGATESFLLVNPLYKNIMDILVEVWFLELFGNMFFEQKQIFLSIDNDRVCFNIRFRRMQHIGRLFGAGCAIYYNLSNINTVVLLSIIGSAIYYSIMYWQFSTTHKYITEQNMTYPCMSEKENLQ